MMNDRPVEDPNLQAGIDEVKEIMMRRGLAGACMLVSPDEAAFTYGMHAPWSAIQSDPTVPLGFRILAKSKVHGNSETKARVEGAMHTICQLADFGQQTQFWMNDLKIIMRRAGIDFEHTPFGGGRLPHIDGT